jgi:GT2 family glycosyltransferase
MPRPPERPKRPPALPAAINADGPANSQPPPFLLKPQAGPLPGTSAEATESRRASGSFDLVSDDGWVLGWAWYPHAPTERVVIEILIDGEVAGITVAASHRGDVAAAGMGDGNYGFSWALPYHIVTRPRSSLVVVRDQKTGFALPEPRVFQPRALADAVQKISSLEADLWQLEAALKARSIATRTDEQAAADLFKTVGDFFVRLAEATAAGEPPGSLKTLKNAVADITATYRPLVFEIAARPALSICVAVSGPFDVAYRQLKALRDQAAGGNVEVILLDNGLSDDATLLPLVVRNVRYVRLKDRHDIAQVNEVALMATGELLVFFATGVMPGGSWMQAVGAAFTVLPEGVALAAKVVTPDNILEHAGVEVEDEMAVPRGRGCDPTSKLFSAARPVAAVAPAAFAVRRYYWKALHGLSDAYAGLGPALVDFCLRAEAAGHIIMYDPDFAVVQSQAEDLPSVSAKSRRDDADRLRRAIIEHRSRETTAAK